MQALERLNISESFQKWRARLMSLDPEVQNSMHRISQVLLEVKKAYICSCFRPDPTCADVDGRPSSRALTEAGFMEEAVNRQYRTFTLFSRKLISSSTAEDIANHQK